LLNQINFDKVNRRKSLGKFWFKQLVFRIVEKETEFTIIYFGIVKEFHPEKGFGFLTHPISLGPRRDIFFHITNVKWSDESLAERISTNEKICFWYVAEQTPKGEQLCGILSPLEVFNLHHINASDFNDNIKLIWRDIEKSIPIWLEVATIGLFGLNGNDELKSEREKLIQKRNEEREIQLKEQERIRKEIEEKARIEREKRAEERKKQEIEKADAQKQAQDERKRQQEQKRHQENLMEEEFELLVAEIQNMGFKLSAQVSKYIVENRLGDKYQTISGILEMENGGSTWKFKGGFPPEIYGALCRRLNLDNNGTDSKVIGFTPFKDLNSE